MNHKFTRRTFLQTTAGAAAFTAMGACSAAPAQPGSPTRSSGGIVDTNVWLSRWPFRRLPLDETPALVTKLRTAGVVAAWAGSFDGMLHKDLASANTRLAD